MEIQNDVTGIKGSIFSLLSFIFRKHHVCCALVGGYALIANKVQRMTFDIDFIITAHDYSKIEPDLSKMGYAAFNRQDAFVQLKSDKPGMRDIDFLISDPETIQGILSQGKEISIAGEAFFVPSPMHLIAMKLHSMANSNDREFKDLPDIIQLMMINSINPIDKEVQELFRKYHAMTWFDKVVKAMGERT